MRYPFPTTRNINVANIGCLREQLSIFGIKTMRLVGMMTYFLCLHYLLNEKNAKLLRINDDALV